MPNFGEVTREFLQFPIYYYDVVYSQSLPVRGYAGCASVLVNAWDPIAVAPALLNVDASGNLKITGAISATTSAVATAAAPTYVEGTTNALSMDLGGGIRITGTINASSTVKSTAAAPTYVEGTSNPFSSDLAGNLRIIGALTDTQLRATPVPVSGTVAVTGTFFQTTQPVSLASIPNEPNMDIPLSSLVSNLMVENLLQAQQLAVTRAGAAGFVPMETPSFLAGFGY